jgi:hypothetical protein
VTFTAGTNVTFSQTGNNLTINASGAGISDGDKGDITVSASGATWTIDNTVVTYAKIQDVTDARLLGRSAGTAGSAQEITVGTGLSLSAGNLTSTITQYTDALARAAISETVTGLDYNNTSGVLSLTTGYVIPTTTQETNWNTAFSNYLQWDGGSTNLVAATGRTSLGGTTVGQNVFTSTNPSAIRFLRANADNTVDWLSDADFRTAIGAGTGNGTLTSVNLSFSGASSPVTLASDAGSDVVLTAGTNVTFSQTGNNLTINATGGGGVTSVNSVGAGASLVKTTTGAVEIYSLTSGTNQSANADLTFNTNANDVEIDVNGNSDVSSGIGSLLESDQQGNLRLNNLITGWQTIATAAGTTTLTNASPLATVFTGTTTQTVVLPDATTLTTGWAFHISNQSTGAVTIQTNGGATLWIVAGGSDLDVECTSIGTAAGTWEIDYRVGNSASGKRSVFNNSFTFNGTDNTTFTFPTTDQTLVGTTATQTLTNKRITKRVTTVASNATWAPSGDNDDMYTVTAQAVNVTTISSPGGTPTEGQELLLRVKDDGTARAISGWNAIYRAGTNLAFPTTTTLGKVMYIKFIYNSTDARWDLVSVIDGL